MALDFGSIFSSIASGVKSGIEADLGVKFSGGAAGEEAASERARKKKKLDIEMVGDLEIEQSKKKHEQKVAWEQEPPTVLIGKNKTPEAQASVEMRMLIGGVNNYVLKNGLEIGMPNFVENIVSSRGKKALNEDRVQRYAAEASKADAQNRLSGFNRTVQRPPAEVNRGY